MFNLAKNKGKLKELVEKTVREVGPSFTEDDKSTPEKYLQEKTVFEQTIKSLGRPKAIMEDAKAIAFHLLNRQIKDPSVMMGKVDKWRFVREFDPKYYQAVVRQVKRYLQHDGKALKKLIPAIPQKQPAGGGAEMGAPEGMGVGMAFNKQKIVKEGQMYVYRRDSSPHKLLGTIGSDIISGKLQFLNEWGEPYVLRTKAGESLSLKRSSPTIQQAIKLNDYLPDKIIEVISSFLTEKGIEEAEDIARSAYLRLRKKRNFDLLPVSLALTTPLHVLKMKMANLSEPQDLYDLRVRIGKVCEPAIAKLKNALLLDQIKFEEKKSFLPSFCINSHLLEESEENLSDKHPSRTMRILEDDASTSTDMKSLLLTLTHPESKFKEQAAFRICDLISRYPSLLADGVLSAQDISALERAAPDYASHVVKLIKLLDADEADLMKAYFDGDSFDKYLVSNLVASLEKDNVFFAMPEMCMLHNSVNLDLFEKLDPKDPTTTKILLKIKIYDLDVPQKMYEKKVCQVLCMRKDEDLIKLCLSQSVNLASFCVSILAEDGALEKEDLARYYSRSSQNENAALAAIQVMEKAEDQLANFQKAFGIMPSMISLVSSKKTASLYMKANRITWDGRKVPTASELFSLPENPMNLAISLINIQDVSAMISLLYACCKAYSEGNKKLQPTILFLVKELKNQGEQEKAYLIVSNFGIELGQDEDILPNEAATPDRIVFYIESGDVVSAAHLLNQLFAKDEEAARMTLENLPKPKDATTFLELLPVELITSVDLPLWAKRINTKAVLLPNGIMITGSRGIYECMGRSFASSEGRLVESAMRLLVGTKPN